MKKKIWIVSLMLGAALSLTACSAKKQSIKSKQQIQRVNVKNSDDKYDKIIKKMSLDEKIGQLYFAHSNGNFAQMKKDVNRYHLGGITLFAPDFHNRNQRQFINQMNQYQAASKHGLFIATDQEGGTVSRLNSNPEICNRDFPSPQSIYQKKGLTAVIQEQAKVAQLLHQYKINMNFAPIADVAKNSNSFIYNRTLGDTYINTSSYITQAVKAIQKQNVAATLKHFPGYGDAGDTHTGFATINKSIKNYEKEDLLPFKAGIKAGVDGIMVSHIIIKKIDSKYPASLSTKVHQLLRKKLSYSGLIISDDLEMGAITDFAKLHKTNTDVLALKAGNDLLLGGNYKTGIKRIKQAVKKKQIKESQINESVRRILILKDKLNILK